MGDLKVFIAAALVTAELFVFVLCEDGGPKVDLSIPSEQVRLFIKAALFLVLTRI